MRALSNNVVDDFPKFWELSRRIAATQRVELVHDGWLSVLVTLPKSIEERGLIFFA